MLKHEGSVHVKPAIITEKNISMPDTTEQVPRQGSPLNGAGRRVYGVFVLTMLCWSCEVTPGLSLHKGRHVTGEVRRRQDTQGIIEQHISKSNTHTHTHTQAALNTPHQMSV